jgi:hypothetical protein
MESKAIDPGRLPRGAAQALGLARTFGHYYDEFRCVGGVWKMSSMRLVSTFRDR